MFLLYFDVVQLFGTLFCERHYINKLYLLLLLTVFCALLLTDTFVHDPSEPLSPIGKVE